MGVAKLIASYFDRLNPLTPVIVHIETPNGSTGQNRKGKPHIKIKLKSWWCLVNYVLFGPAGFAIDYVRGYIDIEGDLRYLGFVSSIYTKQSMLKQRVRTGIHSRFPLEYIWNRFHMLRHLAWNYKNAQYNAEFHYGHDPEFYFNYLGPTGAYSTGIWYEATAHVDQAQNNKWEFILQKLMLQPGMKVLSVGSGFGYGEMLAAEKYGVSVDCVNVCRPQNKWLREEVKRRGLEDRVRVFDDEYRALHKKHRGEYDRLLVIECIEHAGNMFRKKTIDSLATCLKDEGVGVIQFLSWDIDSEVAYFIRSRLYPAVTMPPMSKVMEELAFAGCEIVDLACFRRDYNYTLNAWTDNFLQNWDKIVAINPEKYTESFMRTWYMYLASGAFYLKTPDATARLYQITFTKGTTTSYPMHRDFLHDPHASKEAWVRPDPWTFYTKPQGEKVFGQKESSRANLRKGRIRSTVYETFDPVA